MNDRVFLSDAELAKHGEVQNLSQKAASLLDHQKVNWNLVNENFKAIAEVQTKRYEFGNFHVRTQFNSSRIISSSAKVDKKSISNRACFLCEDSLPASQKGINYKDKYVILVNPYPIFKQHLTIPHHTHTPQSISNSFVDLLDLSYDLRDNFFVFYNGPRCGASAPDHLHFQAGQRKSTPLEEYYKSLIESGKLLLSTDNFRIGLVTESVFNFVYIQSSSSKQIEMVFEKVLQQLNNFDDSAEEPLLNVISIYDNDQWNLFIIPRKKHRPDQFFFENDSKILISPASVDMAGLCITPRKEDFEKLTVRDIEDIYNQVVFDSDILNQLESILR
jgi:ATP adenylyltransferase/5',5'''-P-1,P-4-tetraphosphate phosphorylase II